LIENILWPLAWLTKNNQKQVLHIDHNETLMKHCPSTVAFPETRIKQVVHIQATVLETTTA
jgi:hypothetical protein